MAYAAWLALLLAALAASGPLPAAATKVTCITKFDEKQATLARYIYELRNNRQTVCSPPDFVENAKEAGFKPLKMCSMPGKKKGDTFVNVTVSFVDSCNKDKKSTLQEAVMVRQCPGQDPLLQPWEAASVVIKVQPMPKHYKCAVGYAPIPRDKKEEDFTPQWEFQHLVENAMKYKLYPSNPASLPKCGGGAAWLTTTMHRGCYDAANGRYEGYGNIEFNCADGKVQNVSLFASGKSLGRENCPWPMILPGFDGYNPAFDFLTNQTSGFGEHLPLNTTPPALAKCLKAAGLSFVDDSKPAALVMAGQVWNKMNHTIPAAVAYPVTYDQVAAAVNCARESNIKPVPRSGGHSYMGYSVMPGQLTISLDLLNSTTLSADGNTAVVQAGSRLGQLYYHVYDQSKGKKAAVGGTCPPVGTGGLFSGGGIGFLTRLHGLACDQLVSLKMVNAKGRLVVADSSHHQDLLAAACGGGGGNFGVVVEWTIKLWDVPPKVTILEFNIPRAKSLPFLQFMQTSWVKTASPKLGLSINVDPDGIDVSGQFQGSKAEAAASLAGDGITGAGSQWGAKVTYQEMSWIDSVIYNAWYPAVKKPSDLLNIQLMEQYRPYFKLKSFFAMKPLPDGALQAMINWIPKIEKYGGYIEIDMLGPKGAVSKVPANATGWAHRAALYSVQYGAEWDSRADTNITIPLIEGLQRQLDPYFEPQLPAYVNYIDVQVSNKPLESYYSGQSAWLTDVKAQYDPTGLFSANPLAIPVGH